MAPGLETTNSTVLLSNACLGNKTFVKSNLEGGEAWKVVVEVFLAFFGVMGNILVTTVITKLQTKKGSLDIYILNLAIADLGILLLAIPLTVVKERLPMNWPFGEVACLYLYPVPEVFYGSSVWCIVVIAIERYQRIVKTKVRRSKNTASLKRVRIIIASVWFASFLFFSFPMYFVVQYREQKGIQWCGPVWPTWDCQLLLPRAYICLLTAFSFVVPLMVVTWTYFAIAHKLNRSSTFIKTMHLQKQNEIHKKHRPHVSRIEKLRLQQNRRAKKLLTPIAVVFMISMLPLNILRLAVVFWPEIAGQEYYQTLLFVVAACGILNSSANPVIYSMVSKDFRQGIRQLLSRDKRQPFLGFGSTVNGTLTPKSSKCTRGQSAV